MKCYKITEKTGNVVGMKAVDQDSEIMIINTEGIIIRMKCSDISVYGRITSGVKLINLPENEKVASVAKVRKASAEIDGEQIGDLRRWRRGESGDGIIRRLRKEMRGLAVSVR